MAWQINSANSTVSASLLQLALSPNITINWQLQRLTNQSTVRAESRVDDNVDLAALDTTGFSLLIRIRFGNYWIMFIRAACLQHKQAIVYFKLRH